METPACGCSGVPDFVNPADGNSLDQYMSRWSSTCGPKTPGSFVAVYCACPATVKKPDCPGGTAETTRTCDAGGPPAADTAVDGAAIATAAAEATKISGIVRTVAERIDVIRPRQPRFVARARRRYERRIGCQ